jgi:hypothetical protein
MNSRLTFAALLSLVASPALGQDIKAPTAARPSFWHAALGVLAANGAVWSYNWYVQRWQWSNVGTRSWGVNLHRGFGWDNDCFVDNQLAHPYHGSVYLGAARGAGYGFWGSLPYVAAGSASWELFFENVRPSINDLINTTLGGMALGEVTFRLGTLLQPHRARGAAAFGREAGAFALSPIGQTQIWMRGASAEVYPAQSEEPFLSGRFAAGNLYWGGDPLAGGASFGRFLEVALDYGSPFSEAFRRPYDAFDFRIEVSARPAGRINHLEVSGLLARGALRQWQTSQLVLGFFQHYDYHDSAPYEFGGQSLSGALLYRRTLGTRTSFDFGSHLELLLLGAISSDYDNYFRRDYDYGPGIGTRLFGALRRNNRDILRIERRMLVLHSVYGAEANHLITSTRVAAALPLGRFLELGGDIGIATRHSWYRDHPSETRTSPQFRGYLAVASF